MTPRRRLDRAERRKELLQAGAELFAAKPYAEVAMEDVAERAGISRAALYQYFPGKRDLFAAIYRQAADRLVAEVRFDPETPVEELVSAGLDAHIDYFAANRNTAIAANQVLAGDPVIQAIINEECAAQGRGLLEATGLTGHPTAPAVVMGWLVFVRSLCVEWITTDAFSRESLRDTCVGALRGALAALEPTPDAREPE
ncbi:TetR/AcrR family transcriptional regulator [Amycolatopsis saalfeldensis]|uniref:Regulatory protein, tetR family n=1 Tax=Amycolatopsis saalfeldensis TaxID=394193 RepID=A0A1H8UT24_9PSEU|nr:TetR/AcrR family transcriptional regulator [Amycolatopsis saalfeldensis]SEP06370.1 regulatory protein, tetR family [Amycolatopsis saalfeldensis]